MLRNGISSQEVIMNLTFKRKLSKSLENRASVITVPRVVAQTWDKYQTVAMIFDGNCLVIKPIDLGSDNA
jgi:hypothetical protein